MEGDSRREKIIEMLNCAAEPLSGTALAKKLKVSRQVIVQDIALLRAYDKNILSTNKGYILYQPLGEGKRLRRTVSVKHTDDQMQDELYTIVDCGARMLDVVVEHEVYGQITVDLFLRSRQDVDEFIEKIAKSAAQPLKSLTNGAHFHTLEADSEDVFARVEERLQAKGYLN
ncbi:MAG: transcription repressor NadR [Lachnospiraceae bacterium]|jgi:Predicted small molecule binding protein (contains 3H domain)|nr:transcription repressor NadR [Lachnospiraceae bacterium]